MAKKQKVYTLHQYAWNKNSQYGEDGVLDYLLSKLPVLNRYCVEFGAWDGKSGSNTYRLVCEKAYKAVYIEPEKDRFEELLVTQKEHVGAITALNLYVELTGEHTLDNILKGTSCPEDPDVVSIDVDSVEHAIWDGFVAYRPKIVVIEYDIYCLPHVRYLHGEKLSRFWRFRHVKLYVGSSLRSMLELTAKKGYVAVHLTCSNIIAVDEKYVQYLQPLTPLTPLGIWMRWFELHRLFDGFGRVFIWMGLNLLYFVSPFLGRIGEQATEALRQFRRVLLRKFKGKARA